MSTENTTSEGGSSAGLFDLIVHAKTEAAELAVFHHDEAVNVILNMAAVFTAQIVDSEGYDVTTDEYTARLIELTEATTRRSEGQLAKRAKNRKKELDSIYR